VHYSEKQWGVSWEQLPDAIRNRIPARRDNSDDRYFTDRYQGQPKDGYTALFQQMLEGIPVRLGVPRNEWRKLACDYDYVIYTGKIDEYFDFVYGKLPYRSLRFEHEKSQQRLPHAVINQCNDKFNLDQLFGHALAGGVTETCGR
jgi:UDP-galactopyranose mutase